MKENNQLTDNTAGKQNAMQIAMYYTREDSGKAEQMIAGTYQDTYAFKVRFSSTMMYGACLIFINSEFVSLTDFSGIISQSFSVDDIPIDIGWEKFENEILTSLDKDEHDSNLLLNFLEIIKNGFTIRLITDLLTFFEINDNNSIISLLKKSILDKLQLQSIKIDVGYEKISSLDMELYSKTSIKLTQEQLSGKEDKKKGSDANKNEDIVIEKDDENESLNPENIKLIFDGALLLKPAGGMHIKGLVVKDSIKVKITDDNPKAVLIAKAFNAYKEGRMYPITGKIVSYRRKMGGGYKIFVEIADGIYIRIDEDESNIKVSFVSPSPDRPPELQKGMEKYVDKYIEQKRKDEIKRNPQKQSKPKIEINQAKEVNIPVVLTIVGLIIIIIILIIINAA